MTDGRVRVKTEDRGWVQRAKLVAEAVLHRRLREGERVTHGPAGKGDDSPANLRIQSSELLEVAAAEDSARARAARARASASRGPRGGRVRKPRRIISAAVDPELHARLKAEADEIGESLPRLAVSLLCWHLLGRGRGYLPAIPNLSHVNLINTAEVDS